MKRRQRFRVVRQQPMQRVMCPDHIGGMRQRFKRVRRRLRDGGVRPGGQLFTGELHHRAGRVQPNIINVMRLQPRQQSGRAASAARAEVNKTHGAPQTR